jgi:hypothetical protein
LINDYKKKKKKKKQNHPLFLKRYPPTPIVIVNYGFVKQPHTTSKKRIQKRSHPKPLLDNMTLSYLLGLFFFSLLLSCYTQLLFLGHDKSIRHTNSMRISVKLRTPALYLRVSIDTTQMLEATTHLFFAHIYKCVDIMDNIQMREIDR